MTTCVFMYEKGITMRCNYMFHLGVCLCVVVVHAFSATDSLQSDDRLDPGDVLLTDNEIGFFSAHWTDLFAETDVDVSDPHWVDKSRQATMDAIAQWLLDGAVMASDDDSIELNPIMITIICTSPEAPYGTTDRISGTIIAHGPDSSSQSMMTWIRVSPASSTTISVRGFLQMARNGEEPELLNVRRKFVFDAGEWREDEYELEFGY